MVAKGRAMINRIARLVMALFALCAAPAHADEFQQWVGYSAKVNLSEDFNLQHETQFRFSDDRNGLFTIQSSLLLGYKPTKNVTIAGGYLHSPNYDGGNFTNMERRLREQVTIDDIAKFGATTLSARLRFEQRWRDDRDGTAWRMRPYVKLAIPLGDKKAPSINLSEEAFVNLNTTSFQSKEGLERFRTSALLSIPLSKTIKLETGYINQHRFVSNAPDLDEHIASAVLNFSF